MKVIEERSLPIPRKEPLLGLIIHLTPEEVASIKRFTVLDRYRVVDSTAAVELIKQIKAVEL